MVGAGYNGLVEVKGDGRGGGGEGARRGEARVWEGVRVSG